MYQFKTDLSQLNGGTMRLAYRELLEDRVTDVEAWQQVHRICPDAALAQLQWAFMELGWQGAAAFLLAFTESAPFLFTRLPGGVAFDGEQRTAAFTDAASYDTFAASFPDWAVCRVIL